VRLVPPRSLHLLDSTLVTMRTEPQTPLGSPKLRAAYSCERPTLHVPSFTACPAAAVSNDDPASPRRPFARPPAQTLVFFRACLPSTAPGSSGKAETLKFFLHLHMHILRVYAKRHDRLPPSTLPGDKGFDTFVGLFGLRGSVEI
jgi:hypothetical protein